jgi:hypothetical protein
LRYHLTGAARLSPSGIAAQRRNGAAVWLGTADLAMTTRRSPGRSAAIGLAHLPALRERIVERSAGRDLPRGGVLTVNR